jgi:hypothetical protein
MALSDLRKTVLQIINEVEKKLSISTSSSLTATDYTQVLLQLLNEVIEDCADSGDWLELYAETTITAASSVGSYTIAPGQLVHHIHEIAYEGQIAPLNTVDLSDINRLQRLNSFGVPRQYALAGVSVSADPLFRVHPIPGTSQAGDLFTISYYYKPNLLTTSDGATVPPFPANLLIAGLLAKARLEENGGEPSREYLADLQSYEALKHQALNRYTGDTGFETRLVPRRR